LDRELLDREVLLLEPELRVLGELEFDRSSRTEGVVDRELLELFLDLFMVLLDLDSLIVPELLFDPELPDRSFPVLDGAVVLDREPELLPEPTLLPLFRRETPELSELLLLVLGVTASLLRKSGLGRSAVLLLVDRDVPTLC